MQIVKKMSLNGLMVDLEKKMFLKTKQFFVTCASFYIVLRCTGVPWVLG